MTIAIMQFRVYTFPVFLNSLRYVIDKSGWLGVAMQIRAGSRKKPGPVMMITLLQIRYSDWLMCDSSDSVFNRIQHRVSVALAS